MPRTMLTDKLWLKLKPILLDLNIYDKPNLRNIIEGILFRMRTGIPWRDIPKQFGRHNTIFKAFSRWSKNNKLLKLFKRLSQDIDYEWLFIDGTHIRAHQHSTGSATDNPQAISKSAGGNSSKIHMIVDACGNPCEFIVTDGTTHDIKVAPELLSKIPLDATNYVSADKGYDSETFREIIINHGTQAIIPKKRNTLTNNNHMDWHIYKIRHLVENAFARLKHFRSVATRYDKLKQHYENNVALACAYIWLKL
ncbi:IS5 family transposase [Providencia stuartii]|uniref:IS5 family transposase n=1 Tax=Providencia stuartii TaxID=588 RepID=UPI0032D9E642